MRDHLPKFASLVGVCVSLMACSAHADSPPAYGEGCRLVIAGGALAPETESVWKAFIDGARPEGDIVIVPAASGYPAGSTQSVTETLVKYGWPASRIAGLPLAVEDDPDTPETDESEWAANVTSPSVREALEGAAAIWFTGGDQARIAKLFGTRDNPAQLLKLTDAACAAGAAIGGTSAGAAIMSHPMLRGGDSLPALLGEKDPSKGALQIGAGLGFFRDGIVDQHFGERAREGRLITAILNQKDRSMRIGFGVDENTAMVVSSAGVIDVMGEGHVTIIDARAAVAQRAANGALRAEGLLLHMLARGDSYDTKTRRISPAEWRKSTVGREYVEAAAISGFGMAVPAAGLSEALGEGLVDNSAATFIERLTFPAGRGEQTGLSFSFTQLDQSEGYWGRDDRGIAAYTIANIRLDIRPVSLTLEDLE